MTGTILVTGATGPLGRHVVEALLDRVPAERVAALCRNVSRLDGLSARGVDVRPGDYYDRATLSAAMSGVDKLMLVSAPAFTDAITAHCNVIDAAVHAGVHHVHFASIQRRPGSTFSIAQVTEWNHAAEEQLAACAAAVTILRNTLYVDSVDELMGEPSADGVIRRPAGTARAALATRADIAETTAAILAGEGHAGRDYDIAGSHPVTLGDVAATIGSAYDRPVTYEPVPVEQFVAELVGAGEPETVARFKADWFAAIEAGEFAAAGVIEEVLHRPAVDPLTFVHDRRQARARRSAGRLAPPIG